MFAFHISVYFLRRTVNTNQEIKKQDEKIFGLAETDRKFAPFKCDIKWFTTKLCVLVSFILLTRNKIRLLNLAKRTELERVIYISLFQTLSFWRTKAGVKNKTVKREIFIYGGTILSFSFAPFGLFELCLLES